MHAPVARDGDAVQDRSITNWNGGQIRLAHARYFAARMSL
jgi:hypothetical protein